MTRSVRAVLPLVAAGLATIVLGAASAFVLSADPEGQIRGGASGRDGRSGAATTVAQGRALFSAKGCNGCHSLGSIRASAPVGPDLTGLPSVAATRRPGLAAEAYVRESLTEPQAFVVPGFGRGSPAEQMPRLPLADVEIEALVAFVLGPREAS